MGPNAIRRTDEDLVAQLQLDLIADKNVDVSFTTEMRELDFNIPSRGAFIICEQQAFWMIGRSFIRKINFPNISGLRPEIIGREVTQAARLGKTITAKQINLTFI